MLMRREIAVAKGGVRPLIRYLSSVTGKAGESDPNARFRPARPFITFRRERGMGVRYAAIMVYGQGTHDKSDGYPQVSGLW